MFGLVSVIIPIYNAELFLEPCIQSVLSQTHTQLEVLLIDDGSIDGSSDICRAFSEKDDRICYVRQAQSGVSAARNTGLSLAKGEYICFIDADDLIEPDYVETLCGIAERDGADAVFCNHRLLYGKKYVQKKARLPEGTYSFADISHIAIDDGTVTGILFGSVCMAAYRREAVQSSDVLFDPALKRNEDGIFNLCLLSHIKKFTVLPYDGYIYRQWKAQKKKATFAWSVELEKASDSIVKNCADFADFEKQMQCRAVSVAFWNAMAACTSKGSTASVAKRLKEELRAHPISEATESLDDGKLNRFKRILVNLLKEGKTFRFVFLMRYAYPILKKFIKR